MKAIISLIFLLISTTQLSAQWTKQYSNYSGLSFYSIFMIDENDGFVVGSKIYGTTNGGEDWFNIPESYPNLYSVWFPVPDIGIAVGSSGVIIKTTDGGGSWISRPSGTSRLLQSVFFRDANTGWVAGGHFTFGTVILKTTDQGETWVEKPCSESDGLLQDIRFVSDEVGWAVGYKDDGSIIVKSTDGGESWQTLNSGVTDCRLETVFFLNENLGWVGGLRDYFGSPKVVLLKTTNGGDTWISQISNKLGNIHSLRMCDTNRGWAAGLGDLWGNQYGLNYETTDGGNSWIHRTEFDDIYMNSIFFLNPTTGWGNSLVSVYKYQTATDVNEITSFPKYHSLSQNYPNPFNPNTKIKYQIPELSFITLTVYDVLGKEVATLVNEEKAVGSYEVEFNSTGLSHQTIPSGIYFYRLKVYPANGGANEFVQVKKMILLK
jgi:photosystem II stability/assembly factor-like uncharacterized protein